MAEFNPPGWLQNAGATHTAAQQRNYVSELIAGVSASTLIARGGVNPNLGNKLSVTQTGSPSMAVIVKSGAGWIHGSEASSQGAYGVLNDADVTLSIAAAHATLARIDIVVYKVQDTQYSGAVNASSLAVVTGTPSGSPTPPAAPANSITLAQVAVAAAATQIINANITDTRDYIAALGGVIPARTASARPASAAITEGQLVWTNDTNLLHVWDGSAYNQIYPHPGMTKISESVLGSAASSVAFSSIPSTYRALMLQTVVRGDNAAQFVEVGMRFNGDTGTNYDNEQVAGGGATASAAEQLARTSCQIGEMPGSTTVAGSAASHTVFIPWYTDATFWQLFTSSHVLSSQTSGGQASQLHSKHWVGRWKNTAAVTSVTLISVAGNFVTGSSFVLYGLP